MKPLFYLLLLFLSILFADDLVALVASRHDANVDTTEARREASPMILNASLVTSSGATSCDQSEGAACIRHASPISSESHLFSDVQAANDVTLCDGDHNLVAQ